MVQAWWLFVICTVIYFAVSYMTPKPDPEVIEKYTWKNPLAVVMEGKIEGIRDPRIWAGLLMLTLVCLYTIFS